MRRTTPRWKTVVISGLGWVPAATVLLHRAVGWDGLPATLPTHWPLVGEPDGFSSRETFWWQTLGFCACAAAVATVSAFAERRSHRWAPAGAVAGTATAGVVAGAWWSVVGLTSTADSPLTAPLGWWLLVGAAGALWAAPCFWLLGRAGSEPATQGPRLRLSPHERAAWSQVVTAPWLLFVTVGATAAATAASVVDSSNWPLASTLAAVTLLFARVEVSVDRRGLRLVSGLLRMPLKRIPVESVEQAHAEDIRALDWGGWGYRILPGRSALVLRSGPALVLRLTDGRRFAATVDGPETAAALLNGLRAPA